MSNPHFQSKLAHIKSAINQGQFSSAIEIARELLNSELVNSEQVEVMYTLAVSLRLNGNLDEAKNYNEKLLGLNSDYSRAYQELGYIYLASKQQQQAAVAFYQATKRNPALLTSWRALEPLYRQMGNQEAVKIAQAQISQLSALPAQVLGAMDLMHQGDIYTAEQVCRQFLQNNKHHPDAMVLLAQIAIQLNVYADAEFLLESCVTLYPDNIVAGMEYLKLLAKLGKFSQASQLASQLLDKKPNNLSLQAAKASAMVGLGDIEQAVALYQQILASNKQQPGVQLLLGHALKAQGEFHLAVSAYRTAYQQKPDFGDAYWSLANTKTYRFSDQELQTMKQQIDSDNIGSEDKIHFLFALAKAYEDRKDYSQSFQFYERGNSLKQLHSGYLASQTTEQVDQQIRYFDEDFWETTATSGCPAPDPIFIVGLPRAGSTLLEQVLASHPQVDGTMELHNVLGLVSRLRGKNNAYPANIKQIDKKYFQRFGEQYVKDTQVYRQSAPFFIDKMPNNFMHIGLIKCILPNAKIIDARRDPMACCFSGFKQLFGDGQYFTYGLENIGRYYRDYERMMAHWDKVLPGFVLRVHHEDVINDLEGQVKRILEFCQLPFDPACVNYHQTKRVIKTPSSEQVRQPIYRQGMEQWKNYEQWLTPLKKVLRDNAV